jgi:hypothetical protein
MRFSGFIPKLRSSRHSLWGSRAAIDGADPLGWDVSLDDVLDALRRLEGERGVECLWRIMQDVP